MVRDPEFQALPWVERHQLLAIKDPDYRVASPEDQAAVMNGLKAKPWWQPQAAPQGNDLSREQSDAPSAQRASYDEANLPTVLPGNMLSPYDVNKPRLQSAYDISNGPLRNSPALPTYEQSDTLTALNDAANSGPGASREPMREAAASMSTAAKLPRPVQMDDYLKPGPTSLKQRALEGMATSVRNIINSTGKLGLSVLTAINPAMAGGDEDVTASTLEGQQLDAQWAQDHKVTAPQTFGEHAVDIAFGIAPYIAMGPMATPAMVSHGIINATEQSLDQGDNPGQVAAKGYLGGIASYMLTKIPMSAKGVAAAPLVGIGERAGNNAFTDDPAKQQQVFDPKAIATDYGTFLAFNLFHNTNLIGSRIGLKASVEDYNNVLNSYMFARGIDPAGPEYDVAKSFMSSVVNKVGGMSKKETGQLVNQFRKAGADRIIAEGDQTPQDITSSEPAVAAETAAPAVQPAAPSADVTIPHTGIADPSMSVDDAISAANAEVQSATIAAPTAGPFDYMTRVTDGQRTGFVTKTMGDKSAVLWEDTGMQSAVPTAGLQHAPEEADPLAAAQPIEQVIAKETANPASISGDIAQGRQEAAALQQEAGTAPVPAAPLAAPTQEPAPNVAVIRSRLDSMRVKRPSSELGAPPLPASPALPAQQIDQTGTGPSPAPMVDSPTVQVPPPEQSGVSSAGAGSGPVQITSAELKALIDTQEASTEDFIPDLKPGDKTQVTSAATGKTVTVQIKAPNAPATSPMARKAKGLGKQPVATSGPVQTEARPLEVPAPTGAATLAVRQDNARKSFSETLRKAADITPEQADKVTDAYLKNKLAKMDTAASKITVKHGGLLEPDTILTALKNIESPPPTAASKTTAASRKVDPAKDDIAVAISKLGGIDFKEASREWGSIVKDSRKDLANHVLRQTRRFGSVFKNGGLSLDKMRESLVGHGYLPESADLHDLYAAVEAAMEGNAPVSTENTQEGDIEREAREHEEREIARMTEEAKSATNEILDLVEADDTMKAPESKGDTSFDFGHNVEGYDEAGDQAESKGNPAEVATGSEGAGDSARQAGTESEAAGAGGIPSLDDFERMLDEAPTPAATERTDDAGGWKQDVAVKADKKQLAIGGVQKQGGRRASTSDLMDGFTPEPPSLFEPTEKYNEGTEDSPYSVSAVSSVGYGNINPRLSDGVREQLALFTPAGEPTPEARQVVKVAREVKTFTKTARVITGHVRTGLTHITSPQDLAHVMAGLRKKTVENFVVVVTDAQDKIIGVIDQTTGTVNQSLVHPSLVLGASHLVDGAKNVYLIHNHPTGDPTFSAEDRNITDRIYEAGRDTGLVVKGIMAIGSKTATFYDPDGVYSLNAFTIPAMPRKQQLPVEGARAFTRRPAADTVRLTSPSQIPGIISEAGIKGNGVILLDGKNRAVGFVPMDASEIGQLRTGSNDTGAGLLTKTIRQVNAVSMIAVTPDLATARNLGSFGQNLGVKLLDIYDPGTKETATERGRAMDNGEVWYSVGDGAHGTLTPEAITRVKALISQALPTGSTDLQVKPTIHIGAGSREAFAAHGIDPVGDAANIDALYEAAIYHRQRTALGVAGTSSPGAEALAKSHTVPELREMWTDARLAAATPSIAGMHQSSVTGGEARSVITLAVNGATDKTGYHEVMHAAEALGIVSPKDIGILERAYPDKDGVKSGERRADAFADYVENGTKPKGYARMLFDRIVAFLKRLKQYAMGRGWRTAEDVFRDIESGEAKGRQHENRSEGIQLSTAGHGIVPDTEVSPSAIEPLHGIRDSTKLKSLVASMKSSGWQGRPILTFYNGEIDFALTGSHRIAAAKEAGIDIPVVRVDSSLADKWFAENDASLDDLTDGDDDKKTEKLRDMGDDRAAALMDAESDPPANTQFSLAHNTGEPKPEEKINGKTAVETAKSLLNEKAPSYMKRLSDYMTIDPVPKLTRLEVPGTNRSVADSAVQHASARIYIPHMVDSLLSTVFPGQYRNPGEMSKTIDILNKDNILSGYDGFEKRAQKAYEDGDEDLASKWMAMAADVAERHDLPDYEQEVLSAKDDSEISGNIQRWKENVNPLLDMLYNEVKRTDPNTERESRGRHFDTRINLLPGNKAEQWQEFNRDAQSPMPEPSVSNYRNPNVKRDQTDQMAKFTGEYSDDARLVLTSVLSHRWNEATKLRLYGDLVKSGAAIPADGVDRPEEIQGHPAAWFDYDVPKTTKDGRPTREKVGMWIRKDIVPEVRGALNTDQQPEQSPVLKALTQIQLLQIADAVTHSKNIMTVVTRAQGAGGAWKDIVRKMPVLGTADAIVRIANVAHEVMADGPEIRQEIADMAAAGYVRPEFEFKRSKYNVVGKMQDFTSHLLHQADTAARVIMYRFHRDLVDRGLAKDTPESRRNFINQVGQYNRRLMGPIMKSFRDMGVSTFIVAGRNFNRQGRRWISGDPGVTPTGKAAAWQMRLINLLGTALLFTIPAMLNMLTTGQPGGRSGTPLGAWDLGMDNDEKGKHKVIDLLQITGVRRGLRVTGLEAVIEGLRGKESANEITGKALTGAIQSQLHPWMGPGAAMAYKMATGKQPDMRGRMEAQRIPGGGGMQFLENTRAALESQNPFLYSMINPVFRQIGLDQKRHDPYAEEIGKTLLKSPTSAFGVQDKATAATQEMQQIWSERGGVAMTPHEAAKSKVKGDLRGHDQSEIQQALRGAVEDGTITNYELLKLRKSLSKPQILAAARFEPDEMLRVMSKATDDEMRVLRPIFTRKISASKSLTPEDKSTYREKLSGLGR